MKQPVLHIVLVIFIAIKSFGQSNDQCYGPNIGSGSLNAKRMIGCVPFTIEISKNDSVAKGHQFIYDYKGGLPTNPTEMPTFTYTAPGAYKIMQITFRKEDGKELRVCGVVTVLDTNKLILKPKICENKVSLEIADNKKAGALPYDYCMVDWGDTSPLEKIKLPTSSVSHTYTTKTDKKISVKAHYEVEFCSINSSVDIKFPKVNQPQILIFEKTGTENYSMSFNNFSGEDVRILGNNSLITTKLGEIGQQKITFSNSAKNVCYAIKLESNCFPNNLSKEICDIDFEVLSTETSNELRWQKPHPATIKDFTMLKNNETKLVSESITYIDTAIKCNQQNCYQIKFTTNETSFISEKICVKNSLIPCFTSIPIFIPLAFSPNNDGINDFFTVFGEDDKFVSLSIYDQKGKLITTLNNLKESWSGENFQSGIYPFRLKAKNQGNNEIEIIGKMMLVR
jgi:gliding motility-associated-like protein